MSRSFITKDALLSDLKTIATKFGYAPSLKQYKAAGGAYSDKPFRKHFGSWGRALKALGFSPQTGGGDSPFIQEVIDLPSYKGRGKIQIVGDAIIAFDLHSPYHDHKLLDTLVETAIKLNIKTLVLGGDITDFKSLFFREGQDAEFSWVTEMKMTKTLMASLTAVFDNVYWIKGNHDHRMARMFNSNKQMSDLYKLILDFPNLHMLDTFYCEINDWLLVNHPTRARKNKVSFIEDLCRRYRKSILNGHTHRFIFAIDDTGNDVIGEGLHLTEPDLHEYKSRELGTHSEWVSGFWVMRGETITPYVVHKHISNTGVEI